GEEDGVGVIGLADQARDPDAGEGKKAEGQAKHEADGEFPSYHAPPVAQPHLARGHGANDEGGGLRAGVAAARDDEGHEDGESADGGDEDLEAADGGGSEDAAEEEDDQPGRPLL